MNIVRFVKPRHCSPVLSGIYWSLIFLAIGALVLSILLTGSSLHESELFPWVLFIHGVASLGGGFVSAKKAGRKGWSYGMTNGLIYSLLLLTISFLATNSVWTGVIPLFLLLTGLTGAFGGMLGVNASARR